MPSLGSHMVHARTVAQRLALPELEADRGAYYVGCTAPDIRVITRMDRRVTHFYDLDDLGKQDSVARMFGAYPHLADRPALDATTTAFMAGYLTHLVLDEMFIADVYRPYFGAFSPIEADPRANVLDRALQYELDRRDRENRGVMAEIGAAITASQPQCDIPFISGEHLVEWVGVSEEIAGLPADYGRFQRMMTRHLELAGYSLEEINRYCEAPATLVTEALGIVGEERIARFWRDAEDRMYERVRSYLR